MFAVNKYTKWYDNIIRFAQIRTLAAGIYSETHHIIPKSLGGTNDSTNLVILTGKEHLVCHLLLTKMTSGKQKAKMINAAWAMATLATNDQVRYRVTGRIYEMLRQQFANSHSIRMTGRHHTKNTKQKISLANKGKLSKLKGIPRSEETKLKIANSLTGVQKTEDHIRNLRLSHKGFSGKTASAAHRQKISDTRKQTPKLACPHCGRFIDPGNYKKYHGERCDAIAGDTRPTKN